MQQLLCKGCYNYLYKAPVENYDDDILGDDRENRDQNDTLKAIFDATGGEKWKSKNGWFQEVSLAKWHGLTVRNSMIVKLQLPNNNLSGKFPADVTELSLLKGLDLSNNMLAGHCRFVSALLAQLSAFCRPIAAEHRSFAATSGS